MLRDQKTTKLNPNGQMMGLTLTTPNSGHWHLNWLSSPGLIDPGLTFFFIVRTELAIVPELHRNSVNVAGLAVIGCDD